MILASEGLWASRKLASWLAFVIRFIFYLEKAAPEILKYSFFFAGTGGAGILGIHHTGLLCANLERSLEFYCGVLGKEEADRCVESPPQPAYSVQVSN